MTLSNLTPSTASHRTTGFLVSLLRLLLTVLLPILLVLTGVRLLMTPLWLQIEYNRPGFPEDVYGFTREDRLAYAPAAVDYLLNDAGIQFLGDMTGPEGRPLYTERELQHMFDVKIVTQTAFVFLWVGAIAAALIAGLLARQPATRPTLWRALRDAGIITLAAIAAIVIGAVTAWNAFFTMFHNLFFAEGTWMFLYSDTLIRLFPEQFWFDSALVIGTLTAVVALALTVVGWRRLAASPT
jgi:integral membrane protein (TIGR01906 family)